MVPKVRKSGDEKKTKKREREGERDEGGKRGEKETELEQRRNGHPRFAQGVQARLSKTRRAS